ncbi:hypothetical protein [Acetobacter sp.]|uniref:hypothetical protein n=1 Tax=Acetobacter sp. TaxID=440 RepID=UPI0039EC93E0
MFIVDASFVRGTGWGTLESLSEKVDIRISPITAIELASHICESPEKKIYNRSKVNFLKCKLFKMLEDPFWILAKRSILTAHNSRQHEATMIGRLFPLVESSDHLEGSKNRQLMCVARDFWLLAI